MKKGLDYSWARPTGAVIKNAGFQFAVRYIPYPGNGGKGLEPAELTDLKNSGIEVAMVFESFANRALQGREAGKADAAESQKQIERLGMRTDLPIYFAVDFDATPAQQGAIDEYLRGAADVIGLGRVGVYAGYWIIKRCKENGTATWLWQTYAWSGGNVHPDIHLYQYLNGQNVNGSVDYNEARKDNFGQDTAGSPAPAPTPTPTPATGRTYTVQPGDNLSAIGAKTGVDWHQIASINNIGSPYTIYPNQVLHLDTGGTPAPASKVKIYTVQKGDNLSSIGAKVGVAWQDIARINGINDPYIIQPFQVLALEQGAVQQPQVETYTVQKGDMLSVIAAKYGTTTQHLAQINGIQNQNLIYPGQVLRIK